MSLLIMVCIYGMGILDLHCTYVANLLNTVLHLRPERLVKNLTHEHLCDVKLSVIFCLPFPTAFIWNGHSCSICTPRTGWFVISFGTGSALYSTLQVWLSSNHNLLFGQKNMQMCSWLFRTNLLEYMVKVSEAPPVLMNMSYNNVTWQ